MPVASKLYANGNLVVLDQIDESTYTTHKTSRFFTYANEFDEVTSSGVGSVASRKYANGSLVLRGEIDEITDINPSYILAHFNNNLLNFGTDPAGVSISTWSGTPSYTTGYFDNAITFAGLNCALQVTSWAWDTQDYTWEFYVRFTSSLPSNPLFSHYLASDQNWNMSFTSTNLKFTDAFGSVVGGHDFTLPSTLVTNTWYIFTIMRREGSTYVFLNGVPSSTVATGSLTRYFSGSYPPLNIGSGQFGSSPTSGFSGVLDELRVKKDAAIYTTSGFPDASVTGRPRVFVNPFPDY